MWLEEADEDMIRLSDPSSPCCRYTCSSRGRQCFMDLMWTMRDSWPQNPGWLEPPPGMSTQEVTLPSPPEAAEAKTGAAEAKTGADAIEPSLVKLGSNENSTHNRNPAIPTAESTAKAEVKGALEESQIASLHSYERAPFLQFGILLA